MIRRTRTLIETFGGRSGGIQGPTEDEREPSDLVAIYHAEARGWTS
jgi:hypothetical protein